MRAALVDDNTVKKQAMAVLAAVLMLIVVGFAVLIIRSDGSNNPAADPREVACIQAGGDWTRFLNSCKSRAELESELAEKSRKDFCLGLPKTMRAADIPERCLDFYEPVTTTTPPAR
jgi:hypothetical protein